MRRLALALLLTVAGSLPARGACLGQQFIPNLPPVSTFNSDPTIRASGGVAADFDGDGVIDVAVVGPIGAIVYGTPSGRMYSRTVSWSSSIVPTMIVTADFNGDGRPDVAMSDSSTIVVRLTRPDGSFGPEQVIHHAPANDDSISGLATGDFDGDGRQDLLVAGARFLTTYRGLGDGTFTRRAALAAPGFRHDMAVADFDRDGHLDVAAASYADSVVVILHGNGDGTFTIGQQVMFAPDPSVEVRLVAGDFDGDHQTDLAVAAGDGLHLLIGNGNATFHDGSFLPVAWAQTAGAPQRLVAADFDRDSLLDLAVVGSIGIARLRNLGGHFADPDVAKVAGENIPFAVKSAPIDGFAADVDGDGWPDFVELDSLGFVSVLMNGCASGYILRSSSDNVVDGDSITLTVADANGPIGSLIGFLDGATTLGSGNGTFSTMLHGAGDHFLSASFGYGAQGMLDVSVHDHLSSVGILNPGDHSVYGEGVHIIGGVSSDTGQLPRFGNVEILQNDLVLAVGPVINGGFDFVFTPDPGSYILTARYTGAGFWPRSDESGAFRHVITPSPTTLTLSATPSEICDIRFPPNLSGRWAVTVSASAPFASPAGVVTLSIPQLGVNQSAELVDGQASFAFGRVSPGVYAMSATYAGSADFNASQGSGTFTIPACRRHSAAH